MIDTLRLVDGQLRQVGRNHLMTELDREKDSWTSWSTSKKMKNMDMTDQKTDRTRVKSQFWDIFGT